MHKIKLNKYRSRFEVFSTSKNTNRKLQNFRLSPVTTTKFVLQRLRVEAPDIRLNFVGFVFYRVLDVKFMIQTFAHDEHALEDSFLEEKNS